MRIENFIFHIRNFAWLTASQMVMKLVALFVLPITTYYLSPKDFGVIAIFTVVQALLSGMFGMGFHSFAGRMIFKYERTDPDECKERLGAILVYIVIFSTFGSIVASIFIKQIAGLLIGDIVLPGNIYYFIPVAMAFFMNIHGFATGTLLNLQLNKKFFFVDFAQFALLMPSQILGLVFLKFTVWDILVLQLLVQVIVAFYGLWNVRNWVSFRMGKMKIFREAMLFSFPLVPLNFAGWIQDRIDKIFLNSIHSISSVGIYSAGTNLANQYSFISRPVAITMKTEISKRLDSNHELIQKDITESFALFFQISIFLYFAISLFSKEIVTILMNQRFHECYKIVPIFTLSIVFAEITGFFQLKFIYRNQTSWFPISLIGAALLNAYLNFLLIPRFDIYGAAFAKTCSEFIILFTTYYISQRLHKTEYGIRKNFVSLVSIIIVVFIIERIKLSPVLLIFLKSALMILYLFILDNIFKKRNARYSQVRKIVMNGIHDRIRAVIK